MGHLYAIFTTLVWGSCFVLTKVMLTAYTPTQIIPLRMGPTSVFWYPCPLS